jgi:hypothetical protein
MAVEVEAIDLPGPLDQSSAVDLIQTGGLARNAKAMALGLGDLKGEGALRLAT